MKAGSTTHNYCSHLYICWLELHTCILCLLCSSYTAKYRKGLRLIPSPFQTPGAWPQQNSLGVADLTNISTECHVCWYCTMLLLLYRPVQFDLPVRFLLSCVQAKLCAPKTIGHSALTPLRTLLSSCLLSSTWQSRGCMYNYCTCPTRSNVIPVVCTMHHSSKY